MGPPHDRPRDRSQELEFATWVLLLAISPYNQCCQVITEREAPAPPAAAPAAAPAPPAAAPAPPASPAAAPAAALAVAAAAAAPAAAPSYIGITECLERRLAEPCAGLLPHCGFLPVGRRFDERGFLTQSLSRIAAFRQ